MFTPTLALALLLVTPAQNPPIRYVLKSADVKTVTGTVTYTVTCEKLQATEWILFAAVAPPVPGQTKVTTTMSPAGAEVSDLSPLARKLLLAQVKADTTALKTSVPITVTYSATLRSRSLTTLAPAEPTPKVAPLPEKERKLYVSEFGEIEFSNRTFQSWLKTTTLLKRDDESEIAFARRVFLAIRSKFQYEYKNEMDRRAPSVCAAGKSDCGGLSILFVAALRANGVPARTLYGRWAESAKKDQRISGVDYYQWHVKSEFFAAGVGWVPVDMATGILHDKTATGLGFFGQDRGDFITFHIDPDLKVDTRHFGDQTVNHLQRPTFWVRGSGTVEPSRTVEGWEVK